MGWGMVGWGVGWRVGSRGGRAEGGGLGSIPVAMVRGLLLRVKKYV